MKCSDVCFIIILFIILFFAMRDENNKELSRWCWRHMLIEEREMWADRDSKMAAD